MKVLGKAIGWVLGVLFILTGVQEIFESPVAGILWAVAGVMILPVVSKKIPQFKGRKWVYPILCICLLIIGGNFVPEAEESENAMQVAERVDTAQRSGSGEEAEGYQDVDTSKAQEPEGESESPIKGQADFEELSDWLIGRLSGSGEPEIGEREIKKWSQIAEEDFLKVWKEVALGQISMYSEDCDIVADDMAKAVALYSQVYGSESMIGNIAQNVEELSGRLEEIGVLENKYTFDLGSVGSGCMWESFYITQRLEQGYSDSILGKLQKEIDSYRVEESSDWVAYDVEYIFDTPTLGDDYRIIHAESLNPFSKQDVYSVAYIETGETIEISHSGGFVDTVPVYQLIEDSEAFSKDLLAYSTNLDICAAKCREILQELRGNTPLQSQETGQAGESDNSRGQEGLPVADQAIPYEELSGVYLGDDGVTSSLSIYSSPSPEETEIGNITITKNGFSYSGAVVEKEKNIFQVQMAEGVEIVFGIDIGVDGSYVMTVDINGERHALTMTEHYVS